MTTEPGQFADTARVRDDGRVIVDVGPGLVGGGLDVAEWQAIARTLYAELCKWGWGDFHYGHQAQQEESVRKALAVYEQAIAVQHDGSASVGVEPPRRVHQPPREPDRPGGTPHHLPALNPEPMSADPLQVAGPLGEQQIDPGPLPLGQIPAVDPHPVTEPAHTPDDPTAPKRPPALSPEERQKRSDQRDRGVLNDGDADA